MSLERKSLYQFSMALSEECLVRDTPRVFGLTFLVEAMGKLSASVSPRQEASLLSSDPSLEPSPALRMFPHR